MGAQKNPLSETVLLSTQNTCLDSWIEKRRAQLEECLHGIEGSLVRDTLEALYCVLKQDALSAVIIILDKNLSQHD